MKKILCGAMAAVMTVSLAGCAKSESDAAVSNEAETTSAGTVAQAGSSYTGTATAVSAVLLTVETETDGEVTVPLSDSTTYTRGGPGGDGQTLPYGGDAPTQPGGNDQGGDNAGTPPEKPDGETTDNAGTPPEKPDGDNSQPGGNAPDGQGGQPGGAPDGQNAQPGGDAPDNQNGQNAPGGEAETLTYESISVGDTVTVTVGEDGTTATVELAGGMGQGGMGGPGGGSSQPESYTTNTESTFLLSGVDITPSAGNDFFLKCTGNANARGWGQSGANGADCSFTGRDQQMVGDVIWDSISQLDFYVLDGSTLTGAVVDDESNAGNGGNGYANVYIDSTSTWVVTGDSVVSNLYCAGVIVDENGAAVTIVGTDGTVYVQGTSSVTVTVGSYSSSVDTSGAAVADSWDDYAVDKA